MRMMRQMKLEFRRTLVVIAHDDGVSGNGDRIQLLNELAIAKKSPYELGFRRRMWRQVREVEQNNNADTERDAGIVGSFPVVL